MTFFKILWNLTKIRTILESVYLFLKKIDSPDDQAIKQMLTYVNIFKDSVGSILKLLGSDVEALQNTKSTDIEIASLIDKNDTNFA